MNNRQIIRDSLINFLLERNPPFNVKASEIIHTIIITKKIQSIWAGQDMSLVLHLKDSYITVWLSPFSYGPRQDDGIKLGSYHIGDPHCFDKIYNYLIEKFEDEV